MATICVWQPWASLRAHAQCSTSRSTACSSLSFRGDSGALRQASSSLLQQELRSSEAATRRRRLVVAAAGEDEPGEAAKPQKKKLTNAEKTHLKSLKRRDRNRKRKRRIKRRTKKALKAMLLMKKLHDEGGEVKRELLDHVQYLIARVYAAVDKAVSKGTLKKNTGARRKSKVAMAKQKLEIILGWYKPETPPMSRKKKKLAAAFARGPKPPGHPDYVPPVPKKTLKRARAAAAAAAAEAAASEAAAAATATAVLEADPPQAGTETAVTEDPPPQAATETAVTEEDPPPASDSA